MDPNDSLALTDKGVEEVKHRTCKLSIRKRSVLLLLEKPHTIEELLGKSVLQPDELKVEIETLMRDGFVRMGGANPSTAAPAASARPPAAAPQYSANPFAALSPMLPAAGTPSAKPEAMAASGSSFQLLEDIILSEAKYLLVDFSVDSFGTRSQSFADEIGACRSVEALSACLHKVHSETLSHCPERLPVLEGVVKAINETA